MRPAMWNEQKSKVESEFQNSSASLCLCGERSLKLACFKMPAMLRSRFLTAFGMTILEVVVLATICARTAAAQQAPQMPAATPEQISALRQQAQATLSQTSGTLALVGLRQPVNVLRDKWGVAHIFAQNQHDLFFAQGYVASQDRLFQMELWKRVGQGRIAEVLGQQALERDVNARLLQY